MSSDRSSSASFPALAEFAAGYLHEDFVVEHGTPLGAVAAFLREASDSERTALRVDAARFLDHATSRPWAEAVATFSCLGGAWRPRTRAELAAVLRAVHEA